MVKTKPEGCFLSIDHPGDIERSLAEFGDFDEVDYIVVSDGESILGIGDQGIGGIGISIAKLALMTLCAGIHPSRAIPVVLDTGTDRESLRNNPLYLGNRFPRVRGERYDEFIDKFINAVKNQFPKAVVHFEDFGVLNARRILYKYRTDLPCFNDDIQGTGAVTMSAISAASKSLRENIVDSKILVFGAGSAGVGIAEQLADHMLTKGLSEEDSRKNIWLVDRYGLLIQGQENLTIGQIPFATDPANAEGYDPTSLVEIIRYFKPQILIGCSTKAGAFTEEVVREMSKHCERPLIMPLSNPTRLHEAIPSDVIKWTNGRALVATGSPFPPVDGREISENNNCFTFPGIGLGAVLSRAQYITKNMIAACVDSLASQSPILTDSNGGLLPHVRNIREISAKIATSVVQQAKRDGVAQVEEEFIPGSDTEKVHIPDSYDECLIWVKSQMWKPEYRPILHAHISSGCCTPDSIRD
ncbi:hypothetical protein DV451_004668 [Geotrichum candidum]|uniref:Malic enzyme n=1 Tax=Geotrichum candidum TaxID=1173061 RepID=A0A9P5G1M5_GEOCN|nr:hypothetical protein DV451_004668 [Geotrichum candidum]KAF5112044.1 hypothetical protein DV454_004444 [Geotrichum candidum]